MKNKRLLLILFIFFIIIGIITYNTFFNNLEKYTIVNGNIEKTFDTVGYILKSEATIDIKDSNVVVPIIEQYKRVAKNDTIAVYKNNKYEEFSEQISKMDMEIQSLIKDLPPVYSNEVSNIDSQISDIIAESKNTTSYVKIQEYKAKLDDLSYKKVLVLGELSPAGSKIRELIQQREELENKSKNAADNIKAIKSGIVSYKIDDLENKYNIEEIFNYTISDLDKIIKSYDDNSTNKFGIKVINNYNAYIIVKKNVDDNDRFIKEGVNYTIKLLENNQNISGKLVKNMKTSDYNYCIFEVGNGIENFGDNREVSMEIIWTKYSGMAVPEAAIKNSIDGKYQLVRILRNSDYIDIPIQIVANTESIYIIKNMDSDKKKELGIENNNSIKIYDEVILSEKSS